tara:strand:+ start:298 stop:756 length:459 start_codon:yes stop_codon:yes gene_type:complete
MGNCINKYSIQNLDDEKFKKFSLNGITTKCKVLSIYDGDTITIGCKIWGKYFKIKVRMYGYDSPEMKPPKNKPGREKEIKKAKEAKQFLQDNIDKKRLIIEFLEFDKYGRALGNLYIIERRFCQKRLISINKLMIDNNHGYEYFGGTKKLTL